MKFMIIFLLIFTNNVFAQCAFDPADPNKAKICADLGYVKMPADCPRGYVKCPFDLSKVFCGNKEEICEIGFFNPNTCVWKMCYTKGEK